jgi:hypothetical protein
MHGRHSTSRRPPVHCSKAPSLQVAGSSCRTRSRERRRKAGPAPSSLETFRVSRFPRRRRTASPTSSHAGESHPKQSTSPATAFASSRLRVSPSPPPRYSRTPEADRFVSRRGAGPQRKVKTSDASTTLDGIPPPLRVFASSREPITSTVTAARVLRAPGSDRGDGHISASNSASDATVQTRFANRRNTTSSATASNREWADSDTTPNRSRKASAIVSRKRVSRPS